jgi:myo-inositol 2-dehydrogenase/D-chiro-inositol 1-dehydrogenase
VIRIGFLGAGFIAQYHAFMLTRCAEPHELAVVHDADAERAAKFAADWGCRAAERIEDLFDQVDAVFVCTWTSEHLAGVRAAVGHGLPVFCEKPLATDLPGAIELARLVEESGLPNQVGLSLRTAPAFLVLREWIRDAGANGRVMNVVFRDDQFLPTQGMYGSSWRGERDKCGSGALLEHSIHDLDILEWLFGSMTSVRAVSGNFHGLDGIEDSVSVLAEFGSGHTATLASVWHEVLSRPSQRRVEVFCEHALLTLEGDFDGPVRRQTSDGEDVLAGEEAIAWLERRGVVVEPAEDVFLRAVAGSGTSTPTVAEALRAHVLVDAVYRSAAAGGAPVSTADEVR